MATVRTPRNALTRITSVPQRPFFHRAMSLWLKCQCEEFTFDILLLATLEVCEPQLVGLIGRDLVDLTLMLAEFRNNLPRKSDTEYMDIAGEPIEFVMIKKFVHFTRLCHDNVLYDDQTTFGPVQFLLQLLLSPDSRDSELVRELNLATMADAIQISAVLYTDAHGSRREPLDKDTIDKMRLQLDSISALARFFAGMALYNGNVHLEAVKARFAEILEKHGTADEISL